MSKRSIQKQKATGKSEGQNEIDQKDGVIEGTPSITSTERVMDYENMFSNEDSKQIRKTYRDLMDTAQEKADESGETGLDVTSLRKMVHEADEVFTGVKRPREAAMDAQFLKTCGTLAKVNIEATQSNLKVFKPTEFALNLIQFMNSCNEEEPSDDHPQWQSFGKNVSFLYKRAVGIEPMYGVIERQQPKPTMRTRRAEKNSVDAQQVKPKEMIASTAGEERQTEEVTRVFKLLKMRYKENGNLPICFFTFVVNPHSFSLTTENLFHTSFLLRDQYAIITEDDNGLPVIAPRQINKESHVRGLSYQSIISLTKKDWRSVVETFRIQDSMIPPTSSKASKRKQ